MYGHPPPHQYGHPPSHQYAHPPPAYHRKPPHYHRKKRSWKGTCCRCICCCCCFLLLFIIILLLTLLSLYYIYVPQIPTYKVENIEVKVFNILPDFVLETDFLLSVKAYNPNNDIGFDYGERSSVEVTYSDVILCSGKLPSFYQGHRNTTIMKIELTGKSKLGPDLEQTFKENQNNHKIPLRVKVKVPIGVVVADIPLREFKVFVNTAIVLDNLAPGEKISITTKDTKFKVEI